MRTVANEFEKLIDNSKRITHEQFVTDFGGIDIEVAEMLSSDIAKVARGEARENIESDPSCLYNLEFGDFEKAPELGEGKVAAIDGTTALPMQQYSIGQAICVAVGSVTYQRDIQQTLHYWSTKETLDKAKSTADLLKQEENYLFGISQTAVLRYFEARHGLEIEEPFVIFDGPIVYEWLAGTNIGTDTYERLFKEKKCIGIIKNLHDNKQAALLGWALNPGELFVHERLSSHLERSQVPNRNQGEGRRPHTSSNFSANLSTKILRGLFKPRNKAFGFEVHEDHFDDMVRILAADCQMNFAGHEIPFLLNKVDAQLGKNHGGSILKRRVAERMMATDEEIYFENTNERDLRR